MKSCPLFCTLMNKATSTLSQSGLAIGGIEKLYFNLYVFCLESNLPNIIIAIQNRHTNSFTNSMLEDFCNLLKILHPDICIFRSNGICLTFNGQCDTPIFKSDFHISTSWQYLIYLLPCATLQRTHIQSISHP